MIEALGAALLRPWWLLGLLVVLALALLLRRGAGLKSWRRAVDPLLLDALLARGQAAAGPSGGGARVGLPAALASGLIAAALAGPAFERARVGTYRNLDGVVLVLDASRSLAAGGNLVAARSAARAVAEAAGSRQVAVVAFAGDAYLACPFTTDRQELSALVAAIDGDTVPDAGSRPGRGLALAHGLLTGAGIVGGSVVLFSDGGGVHPGALDAARALQGDGHVVHTVFVPPTASYSAVVPQPSRAGLDALARAGGGEAAFLAEIDPLLAGIAAPAATRLARSDYAALAWADLGRLLLLAAAVPVLLLFRRVRT